MVRKSYFAIAGKILQPLTSTCPIVTRFDQSSAFGANFSSTPPLPTAPPLTLTVMAWTVAALTSEPLAVPE